MQSFPATSHPSQKGAWKSHGKKCDGVTLGKEREELMRRQRRKRSRIKDRTKCRLLLCWVLWTNLKEQSREGKAESSWRTKVRKKAEKRHLETGREHRKRFGLTGIINHGPKCSFKGLDLAGGSYWCHSTWQNPFNFLLLFLWKMLQTFQFSWTFGGWGCKIRAWYSLLLTFLFCTAAGQDPPFRRSFYPPQGFCSSNYWDPRGKDDIAMRKVSHGVFQGLVLGISFIQCFLRWGMLKVYRVMKAMAEMNGELLLRKPHNMRPMGYSLKLIGSPQNR